MNNYKLIMQLVTQHNKKIIKYIFKNLYPAHLLVLVLILVKFAFSSWWSIRNTNIIISIYFHIHIQTLQCTNINFHYIMSIWFSSTFASLLQCLEIFIFIRYVCLNVHLFVQIFNLNIFSYILNIYVFMYCYIHSIPSRIIPFWCWRFCYLCQLK